jgi:hypothetical protein
MFTFNIPRQETVHGESYVEHQNVQDICNKGQSIRPGKLKVRSSSTIQIPNNLIHVQVVHFMGKRILLIGEYHAKPAINFILNVSKYARQNDICVDIFTESVPGQSHTIQPSDNKLYFTGFNLISVQKSLKGDPGIRIHNVDVRCKFNVDCSNYLNYFNRLLQFVSSEYEDETWLNQIANVSYNGLADYIFDHYLQNQTPITREKSKSIAQPYKEYAVHLVKRIKKEWQKLPHTIRNQLTPQKLSENNLRRHDRGSHWMDLYTFYRMFMQYNSPPRDSRDSVCTNENKYILYYAGAYHTLYFKYLLNRASSILHQPLHSKVIINRLPSSLFFLNVLPQAISQLPINDIINPWIGNVSTTHSRTTMYDGVGGGGGGGGGSKEDDVSMDGDEDEDEEEDEEDEEEEDTNPSKRNKHLFYDSSSSSDDDEL